MEELNIEKFNPTVAELQTLVNNSKQIVEVDIKDKNQLETVKKNRIALRDARVAITKKGKELREEANAFNKAVISKEKELIAIIEPEEERLKVFEEQAKKLQLRAERLAVLPERIKEIEAINDGLPMLDEEYILAMDATEFKEYCNKRISEKNEKREKELQDREDEIKRKEREKEIEEEAIRKEKEKVENEKKEEAERIVRDRIGQLTSLGLKFNGVDTYILEDFNVSLVEIKTDDANTWAEKFLKIKSEIVRRATEKKQKEEQEEIERKKKEEEAKLEADKKYQEFLQSHGYDNTDAFHIIKVGTEVRLYKQVGSFNNGNEVK